MPGAVPSIAPTWFVDFRRADEVIPVLEAMREQNDAWLILRVHGVRAVTVLSAVDRFLDRR